MKNSHLAKFRREELGFMFQDYNLLNTLTGFENIVLPLSISGVNHKTATKGSMTSPISLRYRTSLANIPMKCPAASASASRRRAP